MTLFKRALGVILAAVAPFAAFATPQLVTLPPIDHDTAELVIVQADGTEMSYTPGDLEAYVTYRIETTTPWREVPASFDGVLLRDVLQANGLAEADAIRVTAENDYTTTIPRAVWDTTDIMISTRVDGVANSRRTRGPIQFVVDAETFGVSDVVLEDHLVWMAARIEAVQ